MNFMRFGANKIATTGNIGIELINKQILVNQIGAGNKDSGDRWQGESGINVAHRHNSVTSGRRKDAEICFKCSVAQCRPIGLSTDLPLSSLILY